MAGQVSKVLGLGSNKYFITMQHNPRNCTSTCACNNLEEIYISRVTLNNSICKQRGGGFSSGGLSNGHKYVGEKYSSKGVK